MNRLILLLPFCGSFIFYCCFCFYNLHIYSFSVSLHLVHFSHVVLHFFVQTTNAFVADILFHYNRDVFSGCLHSGLTNKSQHKLSHVQQNGLFLRIYYILECLKCVVRCTTHQTYTFVILNSCARLL